MVKKISLMFSGGVDSTYAAVRLGREFDEVHLLTFHNEYGHYRMERTARRFEEIRKLLPGKAFHRIVSIRQLFEKVVLADLKADIEKYQSGFVWCMGCKLAMHATQISYDIENGIDRAADGSSAETSEMVEQTLISISMITHLYEDYGIRFSPVAYDETRRAKIDELKARGVRMGFRIGDRFLGVQPKCRPGEIYYMPYLIFHQPPKHDEMQIALYIREKSALLREYLAGLGIQPRKQDHALLRG